MLFSFIFNIEETLEFDGKKMRGLSTINVLLNYK